MHVFCRHRPFSDGWWARKMFHWFSAETMDSVEQRPRQEVNNLIGTLHLLLGLDLHNHDAKTHLVFIFFAFYNCKSIAPWNPHVARQYHRGCGGRFVPFLTTGWVFVDRHCLIKKHRHQILAWQNFTQICFKPSDLTFQAAIGLQGRRNQNLTREKNGSATEMWMRRNAHNYRKVV